MSNLKNKTRREHTSKALHAQATARKGLWVRGLVIGFLWGAEPVAFSTHASDHQPISDVSKLGALGFSLAGILSCLRGASTAEQIAEVRSWVVGCWSGGDTGRETCICGHRPLAVFSGGRRERLSSAGVLARGFSLFVR